MPDDHAAPTPTGLPIFAAVNARLRPQQARHGLDPDTPPETLAWWRKQMLACTAALTQMQARVRQAHEEQAALQAALARAEAALTSVRRELVATRGRERLALHLAQHDGLTRLPNREGFRRRVTEALNAARMPDQPHPLGSSGLAVLFLDLDGMKAVNDEHGHQTGDQVLCIVASRLARAIRHEDMVCRLGGDEFACLLSQPMNRPQLQALAIKLFEAVAAPMQLGPRVLSVRPSIGIAVATLEASTVDDLLQRADTAMYQAKRLRSGHAFHSSAVHALPAN